MGKPAMFLIFRFCIPESRFLVLSRILAALWIFISICADRAFSKDTLLELDIEDLSQIKVEEASATINPLSPKETPAAITVITAEDIKNSGARSLDELLDIYVPGFQYMYKTHGNQAGIRGIISDRNNKLLLTLNGRIMNIKASDGGAVTERWFSMLGDIKRITVINGPGSAVYGPGAIAGIINIETWTGKALEGMDAIIRGGGIENFGQAEIRYGRRLANDAGFFLYYGLDYYPGADDDFAPLKFSYNFLQAETGIFYKRDTKPHFKVLNDNSSFRGLVRHKFHAQLDGDNYKLWLRYTLSGQKIPADQVFYIYTDPNLLMDNGAGNQQFTIFGSYSHYINRWLSLDYKLSFMLSDVQINYGLPDRLHLEDQHMDDRHWSEDETMGRIVAHIIPSSEHKMAIGGEYYYNNFGRRGYLYHELPSSIQGLPAGTKWNSHMFSLFGEYQTHFHDFVGIAGLRADKHRFTDWMLSPRIALIYTPDSTNIFKFIYNRSVRHSDDADLYINYLDGEKSGDIETIDHFEFIYNSEPIKRLHFSLSAFYNRHDVVAFDKDLHSYIREINNIFVKTYGHTTNIGLLQTYGIEIGTTLHTDSIKARLSHNFTKLLDFDLDRKEVLQNVSASPYGYGNDLANWINHATKLTLDYQVTDKFSLHGSARIYWGLPGAKDMAKYNQRMHNNSPALPIYDSSDKAFGKSVFLTLGLEYKLASQVEVSLHGYNLLGFFDKNLNKRNFFQRTTMYRDAAPSFAVRVAGSF